MKFDNIEQVIFLKKVLERVEAALEQNYAFTEKQETTVDVGGIPGFDKGYHCKISEFKDGSGVGLDLAGCYVGITVGYEIQGILEDQREKILDRLRDLGVEV